MDKIVIIGAGIQGLSSAYNIAKYNPKVEIYVVESKNEVGNGSSSRSGSMLMKSRENIAKIQLSIYSYNRYFDFLNEFKDDLIVNKLGFLSLVTDKTEARYNEEHEIRLKMGVPSEILTVSEMKKRLSGLNFCDVKFGVLGKDDCEINPSQIISTFLSYSKKLNVKIFTGEKALDIILKNGKICGVKTSLRTIDCNIVVNAAGADAKEVATWVDIKLPITNKRRSLYYVMTNSSKYNLGPMVEDSEKEWYYKPMGNNKVMIGMGLETDAIPTDNANLDFLPNVIEFTRYRAPELYPFELLGGISGIRPITDDNLPILGPTNGIEGYFNNCGWGGEGIMHSPAGGAILSDWINNTNHYPYDKNCFLLDRFN
ncbi:MAG: FAD-binding oxidoreductase [Chitinophagales bacterium]|nr:FAD-binding oxidoreductase [Chitinophagales bacterium]